MGRMTINCVALVSTVVAAGAVLPATFLRSPAEAAEVCAKGFAPDDTMRFVTLSQSRRIILGTARLWGALDGSVQYASSPAEISNGALTGRTSRVVGALCLGADGLPRSLAERFYSPMAILTDSIVVSAVGDSLRVVRNGEVSYTRNGGEALALAADNAFESFLPAFLAKAVAHQQQHVLHTRRFGTMRLATLPRLALRHDGRAATGALSIVVSDSGDRAWPVWLDDRGALLAVSNSHNVMARVGWEDAVDELSAALLRAALPGWRATSVQLGRRNAKGFAFVHATVVDVERGHLDSGSTVVIRDGRIVSVGRDSAAAIPPGATIIDATGRTMIPGLWDMHAHVTGTFSDLYARRLLAEGVTNVRDPLADSLFSPLLVHAFGAPDGAAPRVIASGVIDGWYPDTIRIYGAFGGAGSARAPVQVRDSAAVRRVVATYSRLGFQWLKVYQVLPANLVELAAREAHARGMRVEGHVPAGMRTEDVLAAGYDEVAHAGLAIRSLGLPEAIDLGAASTTNLVNAFRARRAVLDATLCAAEVESRQARSRGSLDSVTLRRIRARFENAVGFARLLRDAGVQVVAGTDGGCPLYHELELQRQTGLTNAAVLRLATLDAASYMNKGRDFGSISPGKVADVVLIDGNPLADIGALKNVWAVMKGGVFYTDLTALVAARPFMATKSP